MASADVLHVPIEATTDGDHLTVVSHPNTYVVCCRDSKAFTTVAVSIAPKKPLFTEIVLRLAAKKGLGKVWIFGRRILDGHGDNIAKSEMIGEGKYGDVRHFPYFDAVAKIYRDNVLWTKTMEVAVYDLIQTVYEVPERVGLPSLLGHGKNYILTPYYGAAVTKESAETVYKDMARAIYSLHSIGILHRDLKHDNFVHSGHSDTSGYNRVILIDFGLSTWHFVTCHRPRLTHVQARSFRSPEAALDGKLPLYFASDIWSFGMIIASVSRYVIDVDTDQKVAEELTKLFGLEEPLSEKDLSRDLYPVGRIREEARQFLCLCPHRRRTVAKYLGLPEITFESITKKISVADEIFQVGKKTIESLAKGSTSWPAYFSAMVFTRYMDVEKATLLANLLYDGEAYSSEDLDIPGKYFRNNLYTLLLTKYSKKSKEISRYCFLLTIQGIEYPHEDMARWIAEYAGYTSTTTDFPQAVFIQKTYRRNLETVMYMDCPSLLADLKIFIQSERLAIVT